MTPTRLRECLTVLDWSQRGFARFIGLSEGTVRMWARGKRPVPDDIAQWLEVLAQHAERHPPPVRKRQKENELTATPSP